MRKAIREARFGDIPFVMKMLEAFHTESSYGLMKFSATKAKHSLERLLVSDHAVCLVSVNSDDIPVGLIAGTILSPMFTDHLVASELSWFVAKEYRSSTRGIRLLEAFQEWAKKKNCSHVHIAHLSSSPDVVSDILEKHGMTKVETAYMKGL